MEYDYKVFGKTIHILPVCEFHHTAQQFGCSGRTGDTALRFSHICRSGTESLARDRDRNTQYFKIPSRAIALQFGTIALAGFYPYCYTESAIFVKGDRAE